MKRSIKKVLSRRANLLLLLVTVLGLAALAGCCFPRHPYLSALVLKDAAAQGGPSELKAKTPEPLREPIQFQTRGQSYRADLYLPKESPLAALVLVPGAAEEGKNDPRLVAFAYTLARVRFAVLVPDIVSVREFKLGPSNVQDVANAARYLATRTDLSGGGRLGLAATSYAVGLVVLAALESDLRNQVQFIVGIGGYYSLTEVITYMTTGFYRDYAKGEKKWHYHPPNNYGKWAFTLSIADRMPLPADRKTVEQIARLKLEQPIAPVESLVTNLSPGARTYIELLVNTNVARVPELLAQLPANLKQGLQALDVSRHNLSVLRAHLLLFHGRDDDIIPYTESVAMAKAVPKGHAKLFLLHGLAHVDVQGLSLSDKLRLWCAMDDLLAERKRRPEKP